MILKNDLLLRAARGEQTERPPVWLMRQAGRILPQYRAVRNKLSGFIELATTPSLAAEVTVQPVDELGVDAAIIFSDILVIPEAMGLPYTMVEKVGPRFPKTIQSQTDIERLSHGAQAAASLDYVYDALEITKKTLDGRVPLIGFSGAPWTLLAYMVEGGGSKTFSKSRQMLVREPEMAHALLQKLTDTIIAYLKLKVRHGADILQVFDSWAGLLSPALYKSFCIPYLRQIAESLPGVPVILFAKGAWFALEEMDELPVQVLGLDWNVKPAFAREWLGRERVFQGNLDPCALYGTPDTVRAATLEMIGAFGKHHIANLGHGVYPDTPLEGVKCFVDTVKSYSYATAGV